MAAPGTGRAHGRGGTAHRRGRHAAPAELTRAGPGPTRSCRGRSPVRSSGPDPGHNGAVHISAKAEYAVRALLVLAVDPANKPISGETIARSQGMPIKFVENTLVELRRTGLVASQRGAAGGFK